MQNDHDRPAWSTCRASSRQTPRSSRDVDGSAIGYEPRACTPTSPSRTSSPGQGWTDRRTRTSRTAAPHRSSTICSELLTRSGLTSPTSSGHSPARTPAAADLGCGQGVQRRWHVQLHRYISAGRSQVGAPGRRMTCGPGHSVCSPIRHAGASASRGGAVVTTGPAASAGAGAFRRCSRTRHRSRGCGAPRPAAGQARRRPCSRGWAQVPAGSGGRSGTQVR